MGCDIHLHIEVKINGTWHHYSQPNIDRNYLLFEKMAGVCGEVKNAITPPRGLPVDATFITRYNSEGWGLDGHSHSWLGAREIAELSDWGKENLKPNWQENYRINWDLEYDWHCYLFGNSFADFIKYPEERPKGLEDVRFVFWFDN